MFHTNPDCIQSLMFFILSFRWFDGKKCTIFATLRKPGNQTIQNFAAKNAPVPRSVVVGVCGFRIDLKVKGQAIWHDGFWVNKILSIISYGNSFGIFILFLLCLWWFTDSSEKVKQTGETGKNTYKECCQVVKYFMEKNPVKIRPS